MQIFKGLDFINSYTHLLFFKQKNMLYYNAKPLKTFETLEVGSCISVGYGFYFSLYKNVVQTLEKKYYTYLHQWVWTQRVFLDTRSFAKDKFFLSSYAQRLLFREEFLQRVLAFDVTLNLIIILNFKPALQQQLAYYYLTNQQLSISA